MTETAQSLRSVRVRHHGTESRPLEYAFLGKEEVKREAFSSVSYFKRKSQNGAVVTQHEVAVRGEGGAKIRMWTVTAPHPT